MWIFFVNISHVNTSLHIAAKSTDTFSEAPMWTLEWSPLPQTKGFAWDSTWKWWCNIFSALKCPPRSHNTQQLSTPAHPHNFDEEGSITAAQSYHTHTNGAEGSLCPRSRLKKRPPHPTTNSPPTSTATFHRTLLVCLAFTPFVRAFLWEQWFGRKHEWLTSERGELARLFTRAPVCMCVPARVCHLQLSSRMQTTRKR